MATPNQTKYLIPQSTKPFRYSKAAVGLLFATVVLTVLLFFSTLKNINRAQVLMEKFLLEKGETIVHSIEAGSRATMIHCAGGGDPLHTLLTEHAKDKEILFIMIVDSEGSVINLVGSPQKAAISKIDMEMMVTSDSPITRLNRDAGFFSLSKKFDSQKPSPAMHLRTNEGKLKLLKDSKQYISIGLLTEEFDIARKQDVRHTMFMGAILFLISTSGLYFLFLYQKVRLTGSKLENMKVYTDSIIESIPLSLVTLDANEHIVSCNNNTEAFFGYPMAELLGTHIQDAFPDCATSITNACDTLMDHEVECSRSDGKTIPLRISCSPLVNYDGEKLGKVLIIRDMSSLKNMELQLERSRRMAALGKMAAGVAHEIRNPLSTLRGFAQFFAGSPENDDHYKEYSPVMIKEISQKYSHLMISEIDRLNQTVSELLQFSRPRDPQLQHISIDELFKKTISLMAADLTNYDVKLDWQTDTQIQLRADSDLLLQVLMNLLKNSINATPTGGKISLSCSEDEQNIKISVIDSGCGISKEDRERMFDPFFTTTRTGTGLGLAVSHQIIEQHFGTFEVDTEPGVGTSITILLPKYS